MIKEITFWLVVCAILLASLLYAIGQPPVPVISPAKPAGFVMLVWDPSPDRGIGSYRVHYGTTSGTYTEATNAGSKTRLLVDNLQEGETYYFVVTAVGTNQLESAPSNEVSFLVPVDYEAPSNLGVVYVPRATMILEGADLLETNWVEVGRIQLDVKSEKPLGMFRVRLEMDSVPAINW